MSKPKVVVYNQASVDGRITMAPDILLLYGDERWSAVAGAPEAAYKWIKNQYHPQVLLEGSGSFVLENTEPDPLPAYLGDAASLYQDFLPESVVRHSGQRGWFAVVDGRGRGRWMFKEFPGEEWAGWHILILVSRQTPQAYLAYLQKEDIPYLVGGETRVDLAEVFEKMSHYLGVTCMVSTAGGRLNGALLRASLVDEIALEFFPAIIGGTHTPSLFTTPDLTPEQLPVRLKLNSATAIENGMVRLLYQVIG